MHRGFSTQQLSRYSVVRMVSVTVVKSNQQRIIHWIYFFTDLAYRAQEMSEKTSHTGAHQGTHTVTVPSISTTTTLSCGFQRWRSAFTEYFLSLLHGCTSSYRKELRPGFSCRPSSCVVKNTRWDVKKPAPWWFTGHAQTICSKQTCIGSGCTSVEDGL